ncbi:MAG: ABC transporter substrate-binding protein [Gammaproteobacteria bacterium]|nr:ABC transporter substrate-binding protein [Gammaproteobacteria bacterium]
MKIANRVALAAAVFSSFALTLAPVEALLAKDSIKIGSFLAVTGGASFLGDPELKTLQLYVEQINAAGGVNGKQLELVHYDTAGDAKKAVNFVKRLIKKDEVDIIIGGSTSGTSMAVIPTVEEEKIPFISLAGAVSIIEPVKPWVFKVPHTDRMAAERIFADMNQRGISKIALISGDGGFGKSGREQSLLLAPKHGIEVVIDESYGAKDTDVTAQLSKIRGSSAEAILNFGFGTGPAIVTKNVRQLGIDLPLYQSHGVASKTYIELSGDAAEGVRLPAAALLVADKLDDKDPQKLVLVDYISKYENKYGSAVSTFGGHAYDALMIAVAAMQRAGSADKAKVRDEIEKTKGFMGTAGVFNMTPTDHMGLTVDAFKMLEIKGGDWSIIN